MPKIALSEEQKRANKVKNLTGWIDGQMQSIDDKTYKKYFSMRRKNSKWSKKINLLQ